MTQTPPSWFDKQPGALDEDTFPQRKADLLKQLSPLLARQKDRGRASNFYPYLLLRSVLGDRGDRPFNGVFWESPDIWTAPGDPATSPAIPPTHGGVLVESQPSTVYAHVWNLGFAPLAGVRLEYYWFNPSVGIDGSHANLIGMTYCELAGRGMTGSHKLVKSPTAWVPVKENSGHECLVVRVSGIGDPIGGNEWTPTRNRHVAQRNVSVVDPPGVDVLVSSLSLGRLHNTTLQLIQLGPREGELARHLMVPNLRLENVETVVLGEIDLTGKVTMPRLTEVPAGILAPVHPLARGGPAPPPELRAPGATPVVDLREIFPSLTVSPPSSGVAHISELLALVPTLQPGAIKFPPPAAGEALALRLASYNGEELVGGYTMLVRGK
jgi:hypothetical protein